MYAFACANAKKLRDAKNKTKKSNNMLKGKQLLASLQTAQPVNNESNVQQVQIQQITTPPKSDCNATKPTDASVVDQQAVGGQENCEIQFNAKNPTGEGITTSILRIGGGFWWTAAAGGVSKATALGISDTGFEKSANVSVDFGKGYITYGGPLNAFDDRTQDGVLTTGMCIEIISGSTPKVTLVRLDAQGDVCSKQVQKPICPACDNDDANSTFCYEFCRVLGQYNFIEVTLPAGAEYTITMNTDALATANPLVAC